MGRSILPHHHDGCWQKIEKIRCRVYLLPCLFFNLFIKIKLLLYSRVLCSINNNSGWLLRPSTMFEAAIAPMFATVVVARRRRVV